MNNLSDQQLLRDYAEHRSEAVFAELVRRHIDLVHSAALRMVRDPHLAEDVTQRVFVVLAENAHKLTDCNVLAGWLHRTARNLASKVVRSDVRRRSREQEVAIMNEILADGPDADWEDIAPNLDAALDELSGPDRDAILLRYFERKSAREMAETLGISDEAAQKRVTRAVERLRKFFTKRGVTIGAGGLALTISANAVQAAPVGLTATVSTAVALAGTTLTTSAIATTTKAIAMTTLQKTVVTTTLAIAVGTGIYEARQTSELRNEVQMLESQLTPSNELIQALQTELDGTRNQLVGLRAENKRLNENTLELMALRSEVGQLRPTARELERLKAEKGNSDEMAENWLKHVAQLKEWAVQMPDLVIPEIELLTEEDWLDIARSLSIDPELGVHEALENPNTEFKARMILEKLRFRGKNKTVEILHEALLDFAEANEGRSPANVAQLKPYFEMPLNDSILARYEMVGAEDVTYSENNPGSGQQFIAEKVPVDFDLDHRFVIGTKGWGATSFETDLLIPVIRDWTEATGETEINDFTRLWPFVTTEAQERALLRRIARLQNPALVVQGIDSWGYDLNTDILIPVIQEWQSVSGKDVISDLSELHSFVATPAQENELRRWEERISSLQD